MWSEIHCHKSIGFTILCFIYFAFVLFFIGEGGMLLLFFNILNDLFSNSVFISTFNY